MEGGALELLADPAALPGIGELVAWAWIVDPARERTLLVDHHHFSKWLPPGGRVRVGEHPGEAVQRELFEETGVRARFVHPHAALVDAVERHSPDGLPVVTFGVAFLLEASPDLELHTEPGQAAAWWPIATPPDRRAEHHWRRLVRHLQLLGYGPPS